MEIISNRKIDVVDESEVFSEEVNAVSVPTYQSSRSPSRMLRISLFSAVVIWSTLRAINLLA